MFPRVFSHVHPALPGPDAKSAWRHTWVGVCFSVPWRRRGGSHRQMERIRPCSAQTVAEGAGDEWSSPVSVPSLGSVLTKGPSGREWGSGDQGDGGLRFQVKTMVWRSICEQVLPTPQRASELEGGVRGQGSAVQSDRRVGFVLGEAQMMQRVPAAFVNGGGRRYDPRSSSTALGVEGEKDRGVTDTEMDRQKDT